MSAHNEEWATGFSIGVIAQEFAAERFRQISAEGYTVEHDDENGSNCQIPRIAAAYAISAAMRGYPDPNYRRGLRRVLQTIWPVQVRNNTKLKPMQRLMFFKPKDPRRDLVRAGALIIAEIQRLDRLAAKKGSST